MRLLLDEMISAAIAEALRGRGHDVEAVTDSSELRGVTDDELFQCAQTRARALVTCNRNDFLVLDGRWRSQGKTHSGLVIINPRRLPQGPSSFGAIVESLARFLAAGAPYEGFVHWLQ